VTEPIAFSVPIPTYNVTFQETGLRDDTPWTVTLGESTVPGTGTSIVISATDGTYPFSVSASGYKADPASGSITVDGANVTQPVVFSAPAPPTYNVTFQETGLADGTPWSVTLGESPGHGMGTSIVISTTDGTYPFTASASGYKADPASGSITVDGSNVTQGIVFSVAVAPTFTLTFVEQGLPSGTTWWVNITGETPLSSSGTTISIALANGTYTYRATADNRSYGALAGTAVVKGTTTVTLLFSNSQSSPGTGFLGLPGNEGYYALGGVGAAAAIALLLALLAAGRRRKKKDDKGNPAPVGGQTGGPPR